MRGLLNTGLAGLGGSVHVLLEHSNRGKRSLGLDLADPAGLDILYRLAATSDVLLTNKMPGVRKRLKIDVDDIRAHNPNIVYVRGTGYGSHGPDADAGGYDSLGFWARAGCSVGATPADLDGMIGMPAPGYGDSIGAMTIAGGIAAALLHRERTGEAHVVDVSLLGAGMWAMGGAVAISQLNGVPWQGRPTNTSAAPGNPLIGSYRTADNRFLAFSMLQGFHYWPEFCTHIGREDLIADPRFDSVEHLMENTAAAVEIVTAELRARTLAEWRERFAGMKGQWAVVQNTLELADDPQVQANGYLQELKSQDGIEFQLVATPVQFDGVPSPTRRAPDFNEQGDVILAEDVGLDWDTIVDLKVKGIVA